MTPTFHIGISAQLLLADGSLSIPEVDLSPLYDHPHISVSALPEVSGGELTPEDIKPFDAVLLFLEKITTRSFEGDPQLTLIARYGVGYDTEDIDACTAAGVAVVITPNAVRRPVATTVVALVLALTLNLIKKDQLTRDVPAGWLAKTDYNGIGLVGRVLGGVGFGNIGAEVFRLMKPFDMRYIAHDPAADPELARALGVELVPLDDVFRQSDIVTVNCNLNQHTFHLVNEKRLSLMKASAYLINTSRGPVVDEQALVQALKNRTIRGAGLDVFEQEPPAKDNPLLSMEQVILSPHALCFTDQCMAAIGAADVDACLDIINAKIPATLVNPEVTDSTLFQSKLAKLRDQAQRRS